MRLGFTLLELVIVIALIGMLTTTMFSSYSTSFTNVSASNQLSLLSSGIDRLKSLAYSAYDLENELAEHSFNLNIENNKIQIYENRDENKAYNPEKDFSLSILDLDDPANSLGLGKTWDVDNVDMNGELDPITFGYKAGALGCIMNPNQALSIELINKKNDFVIAYLYLNNKSCHLEIIQNNLHE